jgi:deoxyadenosine/deoxycytidine kinase
LQASVDSLLRRIAKRNRAYENRIERAYLEKLADVYARFFHSYDEGPLLIVNASQIDPVHNDADFEQLFQQIEKISGGRHFFNPVAAALA